MADAAPVVHMGENSPEQIAFKLLQVVGFCEGKVLSKTPGMGPNADRKWVLDTYAECLTAAKNNRIVTSAE